MQTICMTKIDLILAKYIPKLIAITYAIYVMGYAIVNHTIPPIPLVVVWLTVIGIAYGLKDYYLEGDAKLTEEELKNYPSWVRNHVVWGLDGARVKRRILMEAK